MFRDKNSPVIRGTVDSRGAPYRTRGPRRLFMRGEPSLVNRTEEFFNVRYPRKFQENIPQSCTIFENLLISFFFYSLLPRFESAQLFFFAKKIFFNFEFWYFFKIVIEKKYFFVYCTSCLQVCIDESVFLFLNKEIIPCFFLDALYDTIGVAKSGKCLLKYSQALQNN